ncbi:hypothetical protein Tfu_0105 [Thermobifida fusca YX]|uniref:ABC transporter ATP-binding protein n=1 Tax=Thermobifida fusca (strain YX) TaxID=269800 RepID=Q47TS1_THEFY|nr:hypothetical protein Tfu_0105 [Thermobifida fusca YX]
MGRSPTHVLPAHAGMIRDHRSALAGGSGAPRACGDDPHLSALLVDELTEALRRTPAAVVVATHDRMMLADCASWPSVDLTGSRVSGR